MQPIAAKALVLGIEFAVGRNHQRLLDKSLLDRYLVHTHVTQVMAVLHPALVGLHRQVPGQPQTAGLVGGRPGSTPAAQTANVHALLARSTITGAD